MSSKPIFFSIVIPVYNRPDLLLSCLRSIKDQSFTEFEVILINDASIDNRVRNIAKRTLEEDFFRKFIYQELKVNSGPNIAKNLGAQLAVGEYIVFLDSDDSFCNNSSLSIINNKIYSGKFCLHMFSSKYLDSKSQCSIKKDIVSFKDQILRVNKGEYLPVVQRKCFLSIGGFHESLRGGEGITWLNLARKYGSISYHKDLVRNYDNLSEDRMSNFSRSYFKRLYKIKFLFLRMFTLELLKLPNVFIYNILKAVSYWLCAKFYFWK